MPRLMGCTHSKRDPASRFRFLQFIPHLEAAGWTVSHRPNVPSRYEKFNAPFRWMRSIQRKTAYTVRRLSRLRDIRDAAHYDVIFINRDLQAGEIWWEQQLFRRNGKVIFDFDDAIYLGDQRHQHIEWTCRNAAWVTAGNETLAAFARQFTDRVTVLPTVVDVGRYACHSHEISNRRIRVGWIGSELSIQQTLFPYLPLLAKIQERLNFDFVIISGPGPVVPDCGIRWRFVPWSPNVELNVANYIDIGLMPLVDNEYQRGKCGLKLLQYMAAAIPAIASPIGVNPQIIRHGQTGLLADSELEWSQSLESLIEDACLRQSLGLAGRAFCEGNYSLDRWSPELLRICSIISQPRDASASR